MATTSDALKYVNYSSVILFNFVAKIISERAALESPSKASSFLQKFLKLAKVLSGKYSIDTVEIKCTVNSSLPIFVIISFVSN